MKKLEFSHIIAITLISAFAAVAFAGSNYFQSVKAEHGAFATRVGIGTMDPSTSYVLDIVGASRITGVPTIVGAPAITGNVTLTGNLTQVGAISVSTSATSSTSVGFKGAIVTLSTRPASIGEIWFQTSDYKLYVSTKAPAHNDNTCPTTLCYSALN